MESRAMFVVLVIIVSIMLWSLGTGAANAGYIRLSDGSLVSEGDSIQSLDKADLNDVYRVKNNQADIVRASDKYGQEIIVIDGKIVSIGR